MENKNNITVKNRITALAGKAARRTDRLVCMAVCTGMAVMTDAMPVLASGGDTTILAPLNNLKTLFTSVVAAIGGIVVVKNIMELSSALQNQDTSAITSGLKGFVGGLLMALVGALLTYLGIS